MIKDRGNKKWTAFMLSEHRDGIKKIWEHRDDIEKPVLDDQQLERLDIIIKEAIRDQFNVKMMYYESKRLKLLEGKISVRSNSIYIDEKKLNKDNIIDVVLV